MGCLSRVSHGGSGLSRVVVQRSHVEARASEMRCEVRESRTTIDGPFIVVETGGHLFWQRPMFYS